METRRAVMAFILAACVVMTALSLGGNTFTESTKTKLRVGVYDNRCVAVAYVNSAAHEADMKSFRKQFDAAKAAGDEKAIARLERAMDRSQWLAHRQAFGRASVDEAMNSVKDKLPAIAEKAKVHLIVCNPDHLDPLTTERVDITSEIVALFDPNEKTLRAAEAMKSISPIEIGFDFEE